MHINFRILNLKAWALLDMLALLEHVYWSIKSGRIPIYSQIISSYNLSENYGNLFPFFLSIGGSIFLISLLASSYLLFTESKGGFFVSILQIPFRILYFSPSISLLRYMFDSVAIMKMSSVFILLAFEVIKCALIFISTFRYKKVAEDTIE